MAPAEGQGNQLIVGGLLVRHGTLLLGKRSPQRALAPSLWDVFGGHVEPGESAESALVREFDEELGIRVTRATLLDVLGDPGPFDGAFWLFLVQAWEGEPYNRCPEEHTEIRWFSLEEMERIPLAHPAYATIGRSLLTTPSLREDPGVDEHDRRAPNE